jgi:hypothetical protein
MQSYPIDRSKLERALRSTVSMLGSYDVVMTLAFQLAINQGDIIIDQGAIVEMQQALESNQFDLTKLGAYLTEPNGEVLSPEILALAYARMAKEHNISAGQFCAEFAYECQYGGAPVFLDGVPISEPLVSENLSSGEVNEILEEFLLEAIEADTSLAEADKLEFKRLLALEEPNTSDDTEANEPWEYHPE